MFDVLTFTVEGFVYNLVRDSILFATYSYSRFVCALIAIQNLRANCCCTRNQRVGYEYYSLSVDQSGSAVTATSVSGRSFTDGTNDDYSGWYFYRECACV